MMSKSKNSRRSFISSLALLSAGTAFGGSLTNVFSASTGTVENLQYEWESFYKAADGELFDGMPDFKIPNLGKECKGHSFQKGTIVYFPQQNLLAQPTWIFWGNEKNRPSDVVITFYKIGEENKKVFALNRFEINALFVLAKQKNGNELLSFLIADAAQRRSANNLSFKERVAIKTIVKTNRLAELNASIKHQSFEISKKLFINI